jgi:predicted HTH transcriptional regulator
MKHKEMITPSKKEEIVKYAKVNPNISQKEIAKKFKIAQPTVCMQLKKAGVHGRRKMK